MMDSDESKNLLHPEVDPIYLLLINKAANVMGNLLILIVVHPESKRLSKLSDYKTQCQDEVR